MGRPRLNPVTSRASYPDVAPIFEEAVKRNGLQVTYETESKAINKAFRLNAWRVVLRKAGNFEYDRFVIRRRGNTVKIEERDGLEGIIKTLDGEEVVLVEDNDRRLPIETKILSQGIVEQWDDYKIMEKINDARREAGLKPHPMSVYFPKRALEL